MMTDTIRLKNRAGFVIFFLTSLSPNNRKKKKKRKSILILKAPTFKCMHWYKIFSCH